ncbi:MAG TPA: hypothetical protein VNS58_16575 [Puia sp.]|nr:hypothetical protein [Puia sp.]
MSFHIGKIIHKLVQDRGLTVGQIQKVISRNNQAVYRIYREKDIDSDRLVELSVFFHENLFLRFQEHELLKDFPNPQIIELQNALADKDRIIANREAMIAQKDKRIEELEDLKKYLSDDKKRLTDDNKRLNEEIKNRETGSDSKPKII